MKIEDYKSIALLNSPFKIVSKCLAYRLASQLGSLVKYYQSGFIKDRNILERVALRKKLYTNVPRKGKMCIY